MLDHFRMFADYNRWANDRLLAALEPMSDDDWHRDAELFFRSVHGTLNHLLVADRVWFSRFKGAPWAPGRLDLVLHEKRDELVPARRRMDEEIRDWVAGLGEADLEADFTYAPVGNPEPVTLKLRVALAHVFNHQTHHRGQIHAATTRFLDVSPALDLIYFELEQRSGRSPC